MTSGAEALEETSAAPASLTVPEALEEPVDAGMMPAYAEEDGASVQCTFSEAVEEEKAMPTFHDDLVVDVEGAGHQHVRTSSTQAEEQGEIAGPLGALEEAAEIHFDHSVASLCPLTPPSSEAQGEPVVKVKEGGVSLNPEVVIAEHEGLAAPAMEALKMERLDEPLQQMEEEMVAVPLLQNQHHPLEYIPPFAREDVFC